jgi:uncharacterized phage protein (TIGR02218 family)
MRNVPTALLEHYQGGDTTLATCWLIEKRDGSVIRGTDHDEDIEITTADLAELVGTYEAGANITTQDLRSTADGAVDNTEVQGAIVPVTTFNDITAADLEAGLFNGAAVTLFVVNWRSPDDGQDIVKYGWLGEVARNSDRHYRTELRGLKQILDVIFVRTYSERCQVKRFGDSECTYDVASRTQAGTVTAVTNSRRFDATIDADSPPVSAGFYNAGTLTFTSGANNGYAREVKRDAVNGTLGQLSFWERFPNDPAPGDTFTISPGCSRTIEQCIAYGNVLNFRGYGVYIEGNDSLMRGPT